MTPKLTEMARGAGRARRRRADFDHFDVSSVVVRDPDGIKRYGGSLVA